MRTIKLKQGDEVTINGYIVRAVGLEEGKADQLQISGYSIVVGLDPTTLPGKRRKEKK